MANLNDRRLRFDPFEVDLVTGELWRDNIRLKLAGQPFQILQLLLERPGELITREEFRKALWASDTFVDFEHGLNAAVNKLRQVLSDDAEKPRYIETIPRRGYRFISEVNVAPHVGINAPAEVRRSTNLLQLWPKIAAWTVVGAACALATVLIYERTQPRLEQPAMRIVPFTSYPGSELCPAFSPDGSRIAFAWNGDSSLGYEDFDLYVKVMGSENLLRLTHHPSVRLCPTWSPDGTQIAFTRFSGSIGDVASVRVVPALGGDEKELLSIPNGDGISMPPVWSPDGKWIVLGAAIHRGDSHWIHFVSVETGEVKEIPHAAGCRGEHWAAFSHSGRQWAYLCMLKPWEEYEIYRAPSSGGPPSSIATLVARFTTNGRPGGLAWMADDKKLLLSRLQPDTGYELDEVSLADGSLQKLSFGQGAEQIAISSKGDKLAFVFYYPFQHIGIWRKDLLHPEIAAVNLVSSTQHQADAQYSPDRKHIVFTSSRAGLAEIWMGDADGTNLSKLSDENSSDAGWPRWSPDSQKIAFSSHRSGHWELYIVDIAERLPRRLVCNLQAALVASWSHDGQWLYFQGYPDESDANERIYRCPATGGKAVALSTAFGLNPWESYDGKTLYFVDRLNTSTIRMVPLQTQGTESAVPGMPAVFDAGSWTVVPQGIYFVPSEVPKSVRYFNFSTRQARPVFDVANSVTDFSVSADRRWLTYTQIDQDNADIMLVEDFR